MKGKPHLAGRETKEDQKSFGERAVEEAHKEGVPVEGKSLSMQEQEKMLLDDGAPTPSVQGRKMLSKYIRPHFEMDKDGERSVELEFSIALADAHKKIIDPEVLDSWKFMEKKAKSDSRLSIAGITMPPQTIDVYFASDSDESLLHLSAAEVTTAKLSVVEKTGDGKTEKVTRLQFRVAAELSKGVTKFATEQFGNPLWIEMAAAQGSLLND